MAVFPLKILTPDGVAFDGSVSAVSCRTINGQIQLIVNTPAGKTAAHDDSYLRKGAIKHRIPYITTMVAAKAAAEGILQTKAHGKSDVLSLQEWHALIK